MRVSTIPSQYGERVVMRLLDKSNLKPDINKLGLIDEELEKLKGLIERPHGIILVTGPTGSGKSTTLYAILSALNGHERNILTVEDPIEYELEGVGQTQVNPRVDMTFARGLRAILRQDPDVVMIGEIRDGETAQIAVQASLTGHPGDVDAAHQQCRRGDNPSAGYGAGVLLNRFIVARCHCPASGASAVYALPDHQSAGRQ